MKIVTEQVLKIDSVEDSGNSVICEDITLDTINSDNDAGMFIRIQSSENHDDLNKFLNKMVRITIEVID